MELESSPIGNLQLIRRDLPRNQEELMSDENLNFSFQHQLGFPSNLLIKDDDGLEAMQKHVASGCSVLQSASIPPSDT